MQSNWKCPQETIFAHIFCASAGEATYRRRWLIAVENSSTAFILTACAEEMSSSEIAHIYPFTVLIFSLLSFSLSDIFLTLPPNPNLTGAVCACCWHLSVLISIRYHSPSKSIQPYDIVRTAIFNSKGLFIDCEDPCYCWDKHLFYQSYYLKVWPNNCCWG